ncbi:MAG TPA: HAMP domain-containing protein [Nannocystaceae bacterium]|nr:HAMP domain-containing protein [Nannocystaceae bacterium]
MQMQVQIDHKQLLDVLTAVKNGDFSARMSTDEVGLTGKIHDTLNDIITMQAELVEELRRINKVVAKEGKISQRANLRGGRGEWANAIDLVNELIGDIVQPTTEVARVIGAVARGDLSQSMALDVDGRPLKGEFMRTAKVVNTMVSQLDTFAVEVTRVAREVGIEGKLGGQAKVRGVAGTWKDLTDNVNLMASNLTAQVRNIADVTTAVARGDLSRKITVTVEGEILELKNTINTMVDQLSSFASEVTRVAREVGTEGKLGGQAQVKGVSGTWRDLTENVNLMAGNLTGQVRNIAAVTTAVARGDLTKQITVDVKGEMLELKNTINTMVEQLGAFASEVTRVAREVGTEGKLGGQAEVLGVSGTWKDLTDNVNSMASNLTNQVRNIADVTTAVAKGELSRKITVDVKGEILELKNTINVMVDQLSSFASEVTRVAREVGTEGRLGGQAEVAGVSGTWKDLTDSVNRMASNLTNQVRNIAEVTTAVANGDLSKKITVDVRGEILELKQTMNTMVDQLSSFAAEVTRVAREVGTEGKLGGQGVVRGVSGTWKDLTDSVNGMASNLTNQVRNIAEVTTAVATGDLSKKITVDVKGEILELKNTINVMVDQLSAFASEVTRVAREVGSEGKLGGQAQVRGVGGTWKDLTDNVNSMAGNLTSQVRNIAAVTTAVANGDLSKKITVDVKGEMLELKVTVNTMVDQLSAFASEVTRVAREVGTEGNLGGQAVVTGVSGTWKDLTESVNLLAANLTTQVRAIAEVATSVAEGDLTRSIALEARGEMEALKVNINQMIGNLRDTTQKNTAQDWLKTNLTRFTRMLQGHRDLGSVAQLILRELAPLVNFQQAAFYLLEGEGDNMALQLVASWAYRERKHLANRFRAGEGLIGQCVLEKQRILLTDVPGDYVRIGSGLGETKPMSVVVIPVLFEGNVKAVIELASLYQFSDISLAFLDQLTESIGIVLNTIAATMRTEDLLAQSQSLARELGLQQAELTETNRRLEEQARTLQASEERLKTQQEELQQTNEELEERSELLQMQNAEVERKNREIELAKMTLEERAQQLSVSSRYKSEFLANMSHELRTPLNSLLLLARMLGDNPEGNLSGKQVEFARTIHAAGVDLLTLINDILDLSKIESGAVQVEIDNVDLADVESFCARTFAPLAQAKSLGFEVVRDPDAPAQLATDLRRLQQILKNLLSNAIKFTERGSVMLRIERDRRPEAPSDGLAFVVTDSGIGIANDKQSLIFEAFQQADGTTSRRFGGTGLGLTISRDLAQLLGGRITVQSTPGKGSVFTLYLPASYTRPGNGTPRLQRRAPLVTPRREPEPPPAPREPIEPGSDEGELADDRHAVAQGDRVLLIVEDDLEFARLLLGMARERDFKGVVTTTGEKALQLARRLKPDAMTLDIGLPDIDGWQVLDRLKHDPQTRHIPVHLISAHDADSVRALAQGAIAFLAKPMEPEALRSTITALRSFVDRKERRILVVEDDDVQRKAIAEMIGNGDVHVDLCASGADALALLREQRFDCMVMDLGLPDMNGFELLDKIVGDPAIERPPIVVYTARDLTPDEDTRLARFADSIIIKSARSLDHLLDETALFLHRVESEMPQWKQRMLKQIHATPFVGKHVLLVDDDVRNIFALTSVLETQGMRVSFAENGRQALDVLREHEDIGLVLLDVMMPEMDGYETMGRIRAESRWANLPIIALTAKAMKGDREKCIAAGASDYITKPVDVDQLLSLMRVWLYRE